MAKKLEILQCVRESGNGKKGPWAMDIAQCIVTDETGKVAVGKLVLPKDHPQVAPGLYEVTTDWVVGFDGRVEARITAVHPVAAAAVKPAKVA